MVLSLWTNYSAFLGLSSVLLYIGTLHEYTLAIAMILAVALIVLWFHPVLRESSLLIWVLENKCDSVECDNTLDAEWANSGLIAV